MQRVKSRPRESALLSEEDSFIEDVVEPEQDLTSHLLSNEAQPRLTEVFRAGEDEHHEMVTIVNPSVRESRLEREGLEVGPGVNTTDHPVSLVYANNEDQFSVDISSPSPAKTVESDPMKPGGEMVEMEPIPENDEKEESLVKIGWGTPDSGNVAETSLNGEGDSFSVQTEITDTPSSPLEIPVVSASPIEKEQESGEIDRKEEEEEKVTPQEGEEHVYHDSENTVNYDEVDDEEESGENLYHPEPAGQSSSYRPVPVESEESDERSKTPEPQIDDYGNILDENGHPIIKHAFPANWILQEDEGDGIMRFETEDGPVRFMVSLDNDGGFDYPNPPNIMRLEMDANLKHIPITHRTASGCEFFVDHGEWRLQLESDVVNLLLRMDIAQDFEDATGEVLWNRNKDVTIENLTRAMTIFKDCVLDDSPVRWILNKDSDYNPKSSVFTLASETKVENINRNVSIAEGMSLVDSKTTVSIPDQSNTEVRNVRNFFINEDSVLENQGVRHLDSGDCKIAEILNDFRLTDDSKLEDQGTRHLLNKDSELEEQGKRHLLCEEGDMVDIVREHRLHQDVKVEDIKRGFQMCEDSDRLDIKRHYLVMDQEIVRTPAIWDKSNFEGELVDLKSYKMEMDMKYEVSPSKFKLNQLDIDDDMLADIEDEQDE